MPIRAENKDRYPKDWRQISDRIRFERAEGRCECAGQCGIDHEAEADDLAPSQWELPMNRCFARHDHRHPVTDSVVVLTVMHLDHDPTNNDPANLLAGCQRCHNRYDGPARRRGMAERAKAKRAIGDLFE